MRVTWQKKHNEWCTVHATKDTAFQDRAEQQKRIRVSATNSLFYARRIVGELFVVMAVESIIEIIPPDMLLIWR